jgi:hypothetical protein
LEVVKRSGKDEPMWVTIHKSMEAMPGIPLYSYLYLKGTTTLCLCYYLLGYLFNKIGEQEGGIGSAWKRGEWGGKGMAGGRDGPNNVYIYE